ncbi:extracellular solute-binding protein [Microbacterium sp. AK009]|uniref:sugar ABC transporter substrate-binding protein n=1 Tax=Microbacterium sp. AK009 TaxID=2723068 RepID=UPI0015C8036B|nr:extracellular solute-binding protein [Microbacterium sp. AK009]
MKVMNKRALGLSAFLVGGAVVLAGCAGGGGGESSGGADNGGDSGAAENTLTVWVDADRERALQDVATAFEEEKGIAVDLVVKEYEDIQQDFITQVPSGEGPDITIGGHDWTGAFVQDGVVAPVELGDKAAEFEEVAIAAVTYDGNTYGLPYAIENIALVRNADLVPEAPTNFDDMIAKGTAAGTQYPFVVGLNPQNSDPYHLYPFQTSFGNSVFAQNADGSYDAANLTIGDEAGQQFATWLGQQGAAGVFNLNLDGDLAKEAFNAGQAPFFLTGPWNIADAVAAGVNVAVDPIPSAGGQTARPFAGVQTFFLSSQSENALAANEFLVNYIATPEVQTALFEAGGRAPALTESFEAAQADPIVAGFAAVGAEAVPMPSIPQMGAVWDDWGTTEVAIIQGADPVSSWTTMAENIQGKIG